MSTSPIGQDFAANNDGAAIPEPFPDWPVAIQRWEWAWSAHRYGFAALFITTIAGVILLFVRGCRRIIKSQQDVVIICLSLFVLSLSRSLCLLVDPYEYTRTLPLPLARLAYGLAYPCLTTSFSLLQAIFVRFTKIQANRTPRLHSYRVLAILISAHFSVVIVVDVTVAYKNNLKYLLLTCQSIYVTWGLLLCFGFIYNGFRVAQFTKATNKAMRELIEYQKVKQVTSIDSLIHKTDLALHRMNKPKLPQVQNEEHWLRGNATSSAGESSDDEKSSSESFSFFNKAAMTVDETTLESAHALNGYLRTHRKRRTTQLTKTCSENFGIHRSGRRATEEDRLQSSDYSEGEIRRSLPKSVSLPIEMNSGRDSLLRSPLRRSRITDLVSRVRSYTQRLVRCIRAEPLYSLAPSSRGSSESDVISSRNRAFVYANLTFDASAEALVDETSRAARSPERLATMTSREINDNIKLIPANDSFANELVRDTPARSEMLTIKYPVSPPLTENGYAADTETCSPLRMKKNGTVERLRSKCSPHPEDDRVESAQKSESPKRLPYPLPSNDGFIGLHRIRQGRILQKVLRIAYVTASLCFASSILQLYALFGVYGVLSNEYPADPWPWLAFQSLQRFAESGMVLTMLLILHCILRQRHRKLRRHTKQTMIQFAPKQY